MTETPVMKPEVGRDDSFARRYRAIREALGTGPVTLAVLDRIEAAATELRDDMLAAEIADLGWCREIRSNENPEASVCGAVLDLHVRDDAGYCKGCGRDSWMDVQWRNCPTIKTLAEATGVPLPDAGGDVV